MALSLARAVLSVALLLALAPLVPADGHDVKVQEVSAAGAAGEAAQASGEPLTIKLRPVSTRKKSDVKALAERLRQLPSLRGCAVTPVSRDILVVSPSARHSTEQLKRELLLQPEVYEVEVGEAAHRREGDKPYDQLKRELLKQELEKAVDGSQVRIRDRIRNKINQLLGRRSKDAAADSTGDAAIAEAGAKAAKRAAKRAKRARRARRRKQKREEAKGESKQAEL